MSGQFIIFLIVLLIQAAIFVFGWVRSTARRRSLKKLADDLGLDFFSHPNPALENAYRCVSLENGIGASCPGYLYADTGDRQMFVFDLQFKRNDEGPKTVVTAILWKDLELDLPPFFIQPTGYRGFSPSFGPEVSLEDRYEIDGKFKMHCPSVPFSKAFLNLEVLDALRQYRDLVIEYNAGIFCIQLKRKPIPSGRIRDIMSTGYALLSKAAKLNGQFTDWKQNENSPIVIEDDMDSEF